jgi:hypothetical protein
MPDHINRTPSQGCRAILTIWTVLWVATSLYAGETKCEVPRYRLARVTDVLGVVDIDLSLRLSEFEPKKLACLADELRRQYAGRDLTVSMFSSHKAAQEYSPLTVEHIPWNELYLSKRHGVYFYRREPREDRLIISPAGANPNEERFATSYDLPLSGVAKACKLAVGGRCLLEFYPMQSGVRDSEGTVTVTGRIEKAGNVSHLTVIATEAKPAGAATVLADTSLANLRTWRFAPDTKEAPLRITYRFNPTPRSQPNHGAYMEFRLPSEVTIQP